MIWEKIGDKHRDGEHWLTYRLSGYCDVAKWDDKREGWIDTGGLWLKGVTHAMPLPEPPPEAT